MAHLSNSPIRRAAYKQFLFNILFSLELTNIGASLVSRKELSGYMKKMKFTMDTT